MSLEYIVEICVAIDIAIVGIAYPIIVDKISNIGDKYGSEYISTLFDYEFPQLPMKFKLNKRVYQISIFKLSLYLTIITFLFLIFNVTPLFGWDNWFINNSAKIIVLVSTSVLTIFFFMWLDKVFLYNGKSTSLLKRIISKYNSLSNDTEIKSYHLKSINELTFYAIEKQDEHLQETLMKFYYREFSAIRQTHDKAKPLIYPIDLYFLVNKLNVQLANNPNLKLPALENRAVSGVWLLGEGFESVTISEETFNWIWRNLNSICEKEKLVKMYWANVSQFFDFHLDSIIEDYDWRTRQAKNIIQVEKRKQERNDFLEFHYALGGLLLYRNQYNTLRYIFEYSQSQPPKYPLLPNSMTEIFFWFENFSNDFKSRSGPIDTKFYFPELDNLGNRRQVNFWICSYLSLLFIRQYSLDTYYVYQNHTALPQLPENVIELNNWLDSTYYFEKCLKETLQNKALISALKWENLIIENDEELKVFISNLKENIKNKIGEQKLNAQLSAEKISQFRESSNNIISASFKNYNDIFASINEEQINTELRFSVAGARTLISKSGFTDNDIPTLNFDSVFASQIVINKIERNIPDSFLVASTKRYLLNKENVMLGIEKIIGANKDVIIVAMNLGYEFNELLKASKYNLLVKSVPATDIRDVLFLLNKTDLPSIEHKDLKEDEISEKKLIEINNELKLYCSVIDINIEENKAIKDQWKIKNDESSLDLKVQITIAFLSVIYWRKERDIIQLNLESRFKEQGIQNDINEIEPLKVNIKEKANS